MKRILSLLMCLVLCFSILPAPAMAARDTSFEESLAVDLKELGLFKGVSDTDFALGRAPTRVEALVMLIRVLGQEEEALNGSWSHPFVDVPSWADRYVGYAYENGLTNGISANQFGTSNATAQMYLTFVLRGLGYSDQDGLDFTYSDPYTLAGQVGILPEGVDLKSFWRADVVLVSYAALSACLKNTVQSLADKLIQEGVFTQTQFDTYYSDMDIIVMKNYLVHIYTMKFHTFFCSITENINPAHMKIVTKTRDEMISMGYSPCEECNP